MVRRLETQRRRSRLKMAGNRTLTTIMHKAQISTRAAEHPQTIRLKHIGQDGGG